MIFLYGGIRMQTYSYAENIKSPTDLGASPRGDLTALSNDVKALISYVDVLVSGSGRGQKVAPLGNKYFMDTGTTCTTTAGVTKPRHVFINNIPDGKIPFVSSAMGSDTSSFKGLVPGLMENAAALNPMALFKAFSGDSKCQEITLATRDTKNAAGSESRYVLNSDIADYSPCWFPNKTNPVTTKTCREGMENRPPKDPVLQMYILGIGMLGAYVVYRLFRKSKKLT